ncbi:vegetative protein [Pyxidicoccus sp. MSG2]|uniref:vegetative protein n=1 Tax=Pyxidicoccus sp. MSG2 TaxID=2996790 RepID=UPI00226FA32F|nr:vegetative protein [Pyxidicoccus sp. MSG2]MCY1018442.1 vegetative protein [Pyxidicoccus sp. MSG2]
MDLAKALGDIFRQELQAKLAPLQTAVQRMEEGLDALELLRSATFRLAPLTSRLGAMAGVRTPLVTPEPAAKRGAAKAKRGAAKRGRPLVDGAAGRASLAKAPVVVKRARAEEGTRACAVMGCKRPSRSKGYCSAHYQKLRLLMRTNRRPAEWVDDAKPQSVREVKLPRGRAASKALQEATPKRSPPPAAPPKPKAWVRKKGKGDKVSLH